MTSKREVHPARPPAQPGQPPAQPQAQPAISGLERCIHCGFCLEACPTYRETAVELDSPRGRIALMRAVAEGRLPLDEGFTAPVDLCLGCRACETACPSGVPYGRLFEDARAQTATVSPPPWFVRVAMRHLFPHPRRMRAVGRLAGVAQKLGLFRWLPQPLRDLALALPRMAPPPAYTPNGDVLFFHGCVQDAFLGHQNAAVLRVVAATGHTCAAPNEQTCCGALHAHYGDSEGARALARRNIAAFEGHSGMIITNAGGCGAHLKEYGHLLADDPAWAERAAAFAARVRDLSEWLLHTGLSALNDVALKVTYQDSCHLAHGQKVRSQPRQLIRAIPGVELVEMEGADQCCGSAGLYNLLQHQMAGRILDEKMARVAATGAQTVITSNPGCYMQMRQGVRRHGLTGTVDVLSLAELLDRAL